MGIPKVVFPAIAILKKKRIVLCIKGIYGIQQACKMIVETSPPDERVPVRVRLDLCPIYIELFQRDKPFFFQAGA